MEENRKQSENRKKKFILLLVIILVLAAVAVTVFLLYQGRDRKDGSDGGGLGYESTAVVVTDQEQLQKIVDDMASQDGKISLEYKNVAKSSDGSEFDCYIANSAQNICDMYIGIYTDASYKEELYLTKLMKPGSGITTFTCNKKMEPGRHDAVLVFTLVEDDHKTIRTQTSVTYSLYVDK